MDPALEAKLKDMLDRHEIWRVMQRYGRGIDRGDYELLRSCYWDDAIEDHGGFVGTPDDFLEYAIGASRHCRTTMHAVMNHNSELDGDDAHVETYYIYVGWAPQAPHMMSTGRYVDHFQKRNGEWRIANRVTVIDGTIALDDHASMALINHGEGYRPARMDKEDPGYDRPVRPRPIPAKQMA